MNQARASELKSGFLNRLYKQKSVGNSVARRDRTKGGTKAGVSHCVGWQTHRGRGDEIYWYKNGLYYQLRFHIKRSGYVEWNRTLSKSRSMRFNVKKQDVSTILTSSISLKGVEAEEIDVIKRALIEYAKKRNRLCGRIYRRTRKRSYTATCHQFECKRFQEIRCDNSDTRWTNEWVMNPMFHRIHLPLKVA